MDTQEPSTATRSEIPEKLRGSATVPTTMVLKDDPSATSEFQTVRSIRVAAKDAIARSQDAYREIETNLKNHAQEFERRQEALSSIVETVSASLQKLQGKITKVITDELEKASQALLTRSAERLKEQADAAMAVLDQNLRAEKERLVVEIQKQFEEMRASRQAFIDETQEQLAVTAQSSLDSLAKATVEKARDELDACKQGVINDSQKELASTNRTSLELLTRDWTRELSEQVRAELTASRQVFIQDTQNQLAKITQGSLAWLQSLAKSSVEQASADLMASHKQLIDEANKQASGMTQVSLESVVKTTVERGRSELSHMVDEFLAKGIPQIEAELRKLVNRHSEAIHTQVTHTQIADVSRLTPVDQTPSRGHRLEFTLAESSPKRRVEARDVWAGLSFGVRLGLVLGITLLLAFAIYLSASPVVRLRASPPVAFFDESPSWTAKQRAREDELARAYWNIASRDIQTKYGFGSALPVDPPDSFKVEEKGPFGTTSIVDTASRARYWEKTREVWPQSDSWERTSDWNLTWISNAWDSASSKITRYFSPSHTSAGPAP